MSHLEPTYLRIIHDGLLNGSIHKDNAADLPEGLTGLYEGELDDRAPASDRQKMLQWFTIWALLKKEVSTAFVAAILVETEEAIQAFITTHSAWFNSPESGKYQLYHERLKVFFLQKMNELELSDLHRKIVDRLEWSIESKKADEFELYSLEFLSLHLRTEAMISGNGSKLTKFACAQTIWQRQLETSRGFTWTKSSLKSAIKWASKYNKNEVIECGLQLVDLNFQIQNSASEIISILKEGHTELALNRIEKFGGSDSECEKRKFTMYMLCIIELNQLDSIDKSHRKSSIAKLLKHLDIQLSTDQTVLNWCEFFPSNLVFQIAFECSNLELDYLLLFDRTNDLKLDWITEQGPYSELQFEVLVASSRRIKDDFLKCQSLVAISTEMFKQELSEGAFSAMQEAILNAQGISDDRWRNRAIVDISVGWAKQGLFEDALSFAKNISEEMILCEALVAISLEFFNFGDKAKSFSTIKEAILCAQRIELEPIDVVFRRNLVEIWIALIRIDEIEEARSFAHTFLGELSNHDSALVSIITEYAIQGKFDKALTIIKSIKNIYKKSRAFVSISSECFKQNKFEESSYAMEQALLLIDGPTQFTGNGYASMLEHSISFQTVCHELAKQGKFDECLSIAGNSKALGRKRDLTLATIYSEMIKKGKLTEVSNTLHKALSSNRGISDENMQIRLLTEVSRELIKRGKTENAITCMPRRNHRNFIYLSDELNKQGDSKEASSTLLEAIPYARAITVKSWQSDALVTISMKLFYQGQIETAKSLLIEAQSCATEIKGHWEKSQRLLNISTSFAQQGLIEDAVTIAKGIPDQVYVCKSLVAISTEFIKIDKVEKSVSMIEEALSCAIGISDYLYKCRAQIAISTELYKQGKYNESSTLINEVISWLTRISDSRVKNQCFCEVSFELVNQGNFELAQSCAGESTDFFYKCLALIEISKGLFKNRQIETSFSVIQEAIFFSQKISFEGQTRVFRDISTELAKQGMYEEAEKIGLKISNTPDRQRCWQEHGENATTNNSCESLLLNMQRYKTDEAQFFYIKGCCTNLTIKDASTIFISKTIPLVVDKLECIELLFQKFALHEIMLDPTLPELQQRLNQTLNIQWAIDIKNQFVN